ncbi:MAG: flaG [Betaproteobacteria bacterium]|nr:flaG [Betaproteobacteria bacterium]
MNVNPVQSPAPEAPRPVSARTAVSSLAAVAETQPPAAPADPTAVKDAVKAANEAVKAIKSELSFSVDEDTGKTVVRVVEKQTGTLIRQIPSQEMLEIAQALDRLQGLFVRNSA